MDNPDEAWASRNGNRRGYRRYRLSPSSRLNVLVAAAGTGTLPGRVIDISRGGARIVLDDQASGSPGHAFGSPGRASRSPGRASGSPGGPSGSQEGTECFVRLLDAGEELRPHGVAGTVRRHVDEAGSAQVAVEFREPLRFFTVPC